MAEGDDDIGGDCNHETKNKDSSSIKDDTRSDSSGEDCPLDAAEKQQDSQLDEKDKHAFIPLCTDANSLGGGDEKNKPDEGADQHPIDLKEPSTQNDGYNSFQNSISDRTTGTESLSNSVPSGIMDLETALSFLFPDKDGTIDDDDNKNSGKPFPEMEREILSNKCKDSDEVWVQFRIGHAGDASALASLFRLWRTMSRKPSTDLASISKRRRHDRKKLVPLQGQGDGKDDLKPQIDGDNEVNIEEGIDSDSEIELRLASGFGDEQTPPAFHAILAIVHHQKKLKNAKKVVEGDDNEDIEDEVTKTDTDVNNDISQNFEVQKFLGGAAILTLEWDSVQFMRILRVDFLHVDEKQCSGYSDLLTRRLLLRLSALGLATGCNSLRIINSLDEIIG